MLKGSLFVLAILILFFTDGCDNAMDTVTGPNHAEAVDSENPSSKVSNQPVVITEDDDGDPWEDNGEGNHGPSAVEPGYQHMGGDSRVHGPYWENEP